jgi:uncharacterized protein
MNTVAFEKVSQSSRESRHVDIDGLLLEVEKIVAPVWPLNDYVAVNPVVDLTDKTFQQVNGMIRDFRGADFLPSWEYFRDLWQRQEFTIKDILATSAWVTQQSEDSEDGEVVTDIALLLSLLEGQQEISATRKRQWYSVSEALDKRHGTLWTSHFINDITRHCSAHYDRGQALWANPWRGLSLYAAWREAFSRGKRWDLMGFPEFRRLVRMLPSDPRRAIAVLLNELSLPEETWQAFLTCMVCSVFGWASYIKYLAAWSKFSHQHRDDLAGLIAIRLAYDVALYHRHYVPAGDLNCELNRDRQAEVKDFDHRLADAREESIRFHLLAATEHAFRRKLLQRLRVSRSSVEGAKRPTSRASLQAVFCIDVRSEVFRRHLEATSDEIDTFGFAGFFGVAVECLPLGEAQGVDQKPVLLSAAYRATQTVRPKTQDISSLIKARHDIRNLRKLWKTFQSSAASCFAFVESAGAWYGWRLLRDSLGWGQQSIVGDRDGLPANSQTVPLLEGPHGECLSTGQQVELAAGVLINLGLTKDFAPVVLICGHGSEVTNNPYRAGLDCGACGGHTGAPNARLLASLLNRSDVRAGLTKRGIQIPDDTWFVAGLHCTTTDEVELFDLDQVPGGQLYQIEKIQRWLAEASQFTRAERALRLQADSTQDVLRRSRDWSEVRPEWGLAGNAAFIVATRNRTRGLNLEGRAFLHSYDYRQDHDGKVLELIMTAPMIVASWINLQYYASTVAPDHYGSGNKLLHNVVGQFGILEGNGGDLKTGLPWQSIHDGNRLQHPPQRLQVFIEAPREAVEVVLKKHNLVRDLVFNGWLVLVVLEEDRCFQRTSTGGWEENFVRA